METNRTHRFGFAVLLLLASVGGEAAAQAPASPVLRTADLAAIEGRTIRVALRQGDVLVGRLGSYDPTALSLVRSEAVRSVQLTEVDTLWLRRSSVGRGAVIGALALGAAGGLLVGAFASGICDAADCSGSFMEGVVIGVPIGAGAGLLLGAGLGAIFPRWERRFP